MSDIDKMRRILPIMTKTTNSYQVFDVARYPIKPVNGSLVVKKIADLGYKPGDFKGLRVADLGASLGFFSFLAWDMGASFVEVFEMDPGYIRLMNEMVDIHKRVMPSGLGSIKITQMDLSTLPRLGDQIFDVVMCHSLIHWFVMFKKQSLEDCIRWLASLATKKVVFEGCWNAEEDVCKSHRTPLDALNPVLFMKLVTKYFSDAKFIRTCSYNQKRVVLELIP